MVIVTDIDRFGRDVVFIVKNVRQIMRKVAVFVAIVMLRQRGRTS